MRVLITGSCAWPKELAGTVYERLSKFPADTTIIHGCAAGVDTLGADAAKKLGFNTEEYPPDPELYGPEVETHAQACQARNIAMTEAEPDICVAFWNGTSIGTFHTMYNAVIRGIPVDVVMMPLQVVEYDHRQLALTAGA